MSKVVLDIDATKKIVSYALENMSDFEVLKIDTVDNELGCAEYDLWFYRYFKGKKELFLKRIHMEDFQNLLRYGIMLKNRYHVNYMNTFIRNGEIEYKIDYSVSKDSRGR